MALSRRSGQRFQASIWPGFVDAMTALLLVLMFVLTIFMVIQFFLRETISGQATELDDLNAQIVSLADSLGLERQRATALEQDVARLDSTLEQARKDADSQSALIATLTSQRDAQAAELEQQRASITSFEAQVATLLAERDAARNEGAALTAELEAAKEEQAKLVSDQEALNLALATARDEVDAQAEIARLAAARKEALEALIADLRTKNEGQEATLAQTRAQLEAQTARQSELEAQLSEAEKAKLADAAAAEALRERLKNADTELTAMTLALEEERKRAEETLTLLAAAKAAKSDLNAKLAAAVLAASEVEGTQEEIQAKLSKALAEKLAAEERAKEQMSVAEERAILLLSAQNSLADQKEQSAEAQRKLALLNAQVAELRKQLTSLQSLLDQSAANDVQANIQIQTLGTQLNTALARVASEEKRRRELEEAERKRLEEESARLAAEAQDLEHYKSEFFGRLRDLLATQEGVRVVGDRFVFSSEVLFEPASAVLSAEGKAQIAKIAGILRQVADKIPPEINWIVRVDGHTDNVPLSGTGRYHDNWELSQGRALSVVRYMVEQLDFPPNRLAANGFGEYQPINPANTPEARAQNRRIELKLTER
ncbi:peptidoglycan -binding protein [Profundibacter sp.]|uniref:peptidoglycan -binding protein n=1 Tax=Profundibacter sp. TaxID=3101071 RepID=UPI003D0D1EB2